MNHRPIRFTDDLEVEREAGVMVARRAYRRQAVALTVADSDWYQVSWIEWLAVTELAG